MMFPMILKVYQKKYHNLYILRFHLVFSTKRLLEKRKFRSARKLKNYVKDKYGYNLLYVRPRSIYQSFHTINYHSTLVFVCRLSRKPSWLNKVTVEGEAV